MDSKVLIYLTALLIFLAGCSRPSRNASPVAGSEGWARGFTIEKEVDHTKITVFNPWEQANGVSFDYYLVNREAEVPESIADKRVIRTPVERVICLSTTHLAFIDALGNNDAVVGISGSRYISNPGIREKMERGKVPDVGYGQNLNYELMVSLQPDLVFLYGIGSEMTGPAGKLEELGIPVVMVAEYLEELPLGKAEWIRFFGALFEKEHHSAESFRHIGNEYSRLMKIATDMQTSPVVMVGSPYKDAWWVPGGNSYLANLISDAGGNYLGKNNPSHESFVISFENALEWGGRADVWIHMGNLRTKEEVLAADQRFDKFEVFRKGKLFNNVNRLSSHGGNDFWESGTVNPHLILQDLISIFHPGLIEEDLVYYKEIL